MKKNIIVAIFGFVFVSAGLLNAMNKPEPLGMGATFEQERQRLANMPQSQKIKDAIRELNGGFEGLYDYNFDLSYDSPSNVAAYVGLGEEAKKLLEEADLNYNRSSDKTLADEYRWLQSAINQYKRNPSERTFLGLKGSILIALKNLEKYYPR